MKSIQFLATFFDQTFETTFYFLFTKYDKNKFLEGYKESGVQSYTIGRTYSDGLVFTRTLSHYILDRFENDASCDGHLALKMAARLRNRWRCDFQVDRGKVYSEVIFM